jgi:hypothetical protein
MTRAQTPDQLVKAFSPNVLNKDCNNLSLNLAFTLTLTQLTVSQDLITGT